MPESYRRINDGAQVVWVADTDDGTHIVIEYDDHLDARPIPVQGAYDHVYSQEET